MIVAPIPANESERLKELYKYELLDSANEADFDQLAQLASQICQVPISTITLIDADRQWFKASVGVANSEGERSTSFCGHAILQRDMMEVQDATKDERFHDNPLVLGDPNIRFYAGMPLITDRGYNVGTLCVIDRVPRQLTPEQNFALRVLTNQCMKLFDLRLKNKELQQSAAIQSKIISIVAHDVRNPMASLKSILELREQNIISEDEANEMLAMSSKQLTSTINMVNNLVDWGKLLLKVKTPIRQPVLLRKLVEDCVAVNEVAFELKNNEFSNLVDGNLVVETDPQALQFIIRNLLVNANKYTENGAIKVLATPGDGWIQIMVSDTGIGMEAATIEALNSGHKTYSTPGTKDELGSGLGLSLVKEFLDKIDGIMEISSAVNIGTSVSITLLEQPAV
jgi:signal transduction histidine kinase